MATNIGKMRHRLALRTLTRVPDGGGGTDRTDTNAAVVWARVTASRPEEVAAYGQLQQRVTHTVTIRFREDVKQGMTVVWLKPGTPEPAAGSVPMPEGTELYVLTAIDANPDQRPREFMVLACEQRSTI